MPSINICSYKWILKPQNKLDTSTSSAASTIKENTTEMTVQFKQNKENLVELIGAYIVNGLYFMSAGAGALDSLCVLCLQPCLASHHGTYHCSILLLLLP